jgi:D-alanine-D-alanine ligase
MRIGITYDLKADLPAGIDVPDDHQEEFDSPATVEAIASLMRRLGHEPALLGNGPGMLQQLLNDPPDFVFNIAEGQGVSRSREARVPAVLEMLGIPHTGSDPLTLAVTLDKDCARRLVRSHGGMVPRGQVMDPFIDLDSVRAMSSLPYTAIVKPAWEGSSKGIRGKCVVDTPSELAAALEARRDQRQPLLVEEFIAGEELTVGVIGNAPARVIGVLRVVPLRREERFIYSLEVKRDYAQRVRYECPPQIHDRHRSAVEEAALLVHRSLGCRDISRVDFRLRDGVPYFLEVNPLPGLNPETSDLVILARMSGMPYEELIAGILRAAIGRYGQQWDE